MKIKTADEVIQEIAAVLAEADGDFIENIANQVLSRFVTYKQDLAVEGGVFEQEE